MSFLGVLVGLLLPSPVDAAKAAVQPNPYAPSLPTQANFAIGQDVRKGLTGPWSMATGSEADYPEEQGRGDAAIGAPLLQFIPGHALPPSMFLPNLPPDDTSRVGQGTGPKAGPFKGWVTPDRLPWGNSKGRVPRIQGATLLDPKERTPLPGSMEATFMTTNAGRSRLEDVFDTGD